MNLGLGSAMFVSGWFSLSSQQSSGMCARSPQGGAVDHGRVVRQGAQQLAASSRQAGRREGRREGRQGAGDEIEGYLLH